MWHTNKGFDAYEEDVQLQLTPVLRRELAYHIYGRMLRSLPFLGWIRDMDACLKELAMDIRTKVYTKGDVLFRRGQPKLSIRKPGPGKVNRRMVERSEPNELLDGGHSASGERRARRKTPETSSMTFSTPKMRSLRTKRPKE